MVFHWKSPRHEVVLIDKTQFFYHAIIFLSICKIFFAMGMWLADRPMSACPPVAIASRGQRKTY
jgi:hypothetical protein